jgi:hypothetical protein
MGIVYFVNQLDDLIFNCGLYNVLGRFTAILGRGMGGCDGMKTKSLWELGRFGCMAGLVNAWVAICITVLSFRYVQPQDCYRLCDPSGGRSCPAGACSFGEQKAGWPFPAFVDAPGGGSPTGGWGILGPEDPPLLVPMILDTLFYGFLLWLALYGIRRLRGQDPPLKLISTTLPLNVLLAACLWLFYLFFGYRMPLGRGHGVSVYVDTPTSIVSVMGFSPIVSIPLGDLIEKYGNPDYVRLGQDGTTETPTIRMALYWESSGMFVEFPQVPGKMYLIDKTTDVEMILFFNEQPYLGISEEPLEKAKMPWRGYGTYQP